MRSVIFSQCKALLYIRLYVMLCFVVDFKFCTSLAYMTQQHDTDYKYGTGTVVLVLVLGTEVLVLVLVLE